MHISTLKHVIFSTNYDFFIFQVHITLNDPGQVFILLKPRHETNLFRPLKPTPCSTSPLPRFMKLRRMCFGLGFMRRGWICSFIIFSCGIRSRSAGLTSVILNWMSAGPSSRKSWPSNTTPASPATANRPFEICRPR